MIQEADILNAYSTHKPADFIHWLTDLYLKHVGGCLTIDNMMQLTTDQHSLLAYRYLLDEVMEGGFIQLILNGYAGYVLEGPFPIVLKKEWGQKDLSKLLFDVKREYHLNREALEREMDDDAFMAIYEEMDALNEMGDDFLDEHQEETTPAIAKFVADNVAKFVIA